LNDLYDEKIGLLTETLASKRQQVLKGVTTKEELNISLMELNSIKLEQARELGQLNQTITNLERALDEMMNQNKSATITAPEAGVVDKQLAISNGSTVNTADILFVIVPTTKVVINAFVNQMDRSNVHVGDEVRLTQKLPNSRVVKTLMGTISRMSNSITEEKGVSPRFEITVIAEKPIETGEAYSVIMSIKNITLWSWITYSISTATGDYLR